MSEVVIGGEDFPIVTKCDRANQHICWSRGNACPAALIGGARRFLVVHSGHRGIGKISKEVAKPSELGFFPQTRKQLLAHRAKQLHTALIDNLV